MMKLAIKVDDLFFRSKLLVKPEPLPNITAKEETQIPSGPLASNTFVSGSFKRMPYKNWSTLSIYYVPNWLLNNAMSGLLADIKAIEVVWNEK
jgi:hypothetical protein